MRRVATILEREQIEVARVTGNSLDLSWSAVFILHSLNREGPDSGCWHDGPRARPSPAHRIPSVWPAKRSPIAAGASADWGAEAVSADWGGAFVWQANKKSGQYSATGRERLVSTAGGAGILTVYSRRRVSHPGCLSLIHDAT